jgi:TonB family protein
MLEAARKTKGFVITTLAGSPSALRVVHSEVWDGEKTIQLSFPVNSVLEKTERGFRIRNLEGEVNLPIEDAAKEINFEELSQLPKKIFEIPGGSSKAKMPHFFVNIYPVFSETRAIEPLKIDSPHFLDRTQEYRKTQVSIFVLFLLGFFALQFWHPQPAPKDEIIPPEYAKLLLSPTLRMRQELKKEAERTAAPAYQVAKAFQNKEVKKTTSQLFNGKAVKDLLVKSTLLTANNSKQVVHNLFAGGSSIKDLGSAGISAVNTKIQSIGGGSTPGVAHYGISTSGPKVNGQGQSLLAVIPKNMEIEEGLTKEEVGKVVRTHLGEVRYCYESAMVRSPNLEGKLVASFVILQDGSVDKAQAKQTSGDAALDTCILEHLSKWKFPNPRGKDSVHVSYPFIFKVLEG